MARPVARLTAELAFDARAELAECPRWDDRTDELLWVDILAGEVHRLDPSAGRDVAMALGRHVGAVAPRASGGWVVAAREGFATLDQEGSHAPLATVLAEDPGARFNDGRVDRAGRFWAGTMTYDRSPGRGALHRLDPDGRVHVVVEGAWLANGIDWSPDDRVMYFADSLAATVDAFDFHLADGLVERRRRLATIEPSLGLPDGIAVDADGAVWVAISGAGLVQRFAPDGRLLAEVDVPGARQVSAPGFGGRALDVLYITTTREDLSPSDLAEQPGAGGIHALRPGVTGLPTAAFAG
jgi:sugar lactone lactonase YvrE